MKKMNDSKSSESNNATSSELTKEIIINDEKEDGELSPDTNFEESDKPEVNSENYEKHGNDPRKKLDIENEISNKKEQNSVIENNFEFNVAYDIFHKNAACSKNDVRNVTASKSNQTFHFNDSNQDVSASGNYQHKRTICADDEIILARKRKSPKTNLGNIIQNVISIDKEDGELTPDSSCNDYDGIKRVNYNFQNEYNNFLKILKAKCFEIENRLREVIARETDYLDEFKLLKDRTSHVLGFQENLDRLELNLDSRIKDCEKGKSQNRVTNKHNFQYDDVGKNKFNVQKKLNEKSTEIRENTPVTEINSKELIKSHKTDSRIKNITKRTEAKNSSASKFDSGIKKQKKSTAGNKDSYRTKHKDKKGNKTDLKYPLKRTSKEYENNEIKEKYYKKEKNKECSSNEKLHNVKSHEELDCDSKNRDVVNQGLYMDAERKKNEHENVSKKKERKRCRSLLKRQVNIIQNFIKQSECRMNNSKHKMAGAFQSKTEHKNDTEKFNNSLDTLEDMESFLLFLKENKKMLAIQPKKKCEKIKLKICNTKDSMQEENNVMYFKKRNPKNTMCSTTGEKNKEDDAKNQKMGSPSKERKTESMKQVGDNKEQYSATKNIQLHKKSRKLSNFLVEDPYNSNSSDVEILFESHSSNANSAKNSFNTVKSETENLLEINTEDKQNQLFVNKNWKSVDNEHFKVPLKNRDSSKMTTKKDIHEKSRVKFKLKKLFEVKRRNLVDYDSNTDMDVDGCKSQEEILRETTTSADEGKNLNYSLEELVYSRKNKVISTKRVKEIREKSRKNNTKCTSKIPRYHEESSSEIHEHSVNTDFNQILSQAETTKNFSTSVESSELNKDNVSAEETLEEMEEFLQMLKEKKKQYNGKAEKHSPLSNPDKIECAFMKRIENRRKAKLMAFETNQEKETKLLKELEELCRNPGDHFNEEYKKVLQKLKVETETINLVHKA